MDISYFLYFFARTSTDPYNSCYWN